MKFLIKGFFNKCDQIRTFLQIWSHLLKKILNAKILFCVVSNSMNGKCCKYLALTSAPSYLLIYFGSRVVSYLTTARYVNEIHLLWVVRFVQLTQKIAKKLFFLCRSIFIGILKNQGNILEEAFFRNTKNLSKHLRWIFFYKYQEALYF